MGTEKLVQDFEKKKREMLSLLSFELANDILITDSIDMLEPQIHGRAA